MVTGRVLSQGRGVYSMAVAKACLSQNSTKQTAASGSRINDFND